MQSYLQAYRYSNPKDKCYIGKMRNKAAKKMRIFEDYYLTDSNNVIIQSKFVETYFTFFQDDQSFKVQEALDLVYDAIEVGNYSKSKKKTLLESAKILEDFKNKKHPYIPSLKELKIGYWDLEAYKNNIY